MEVKDKIKRLRKERKWSQKELAKKMSLSPASVCLWETGETYPTLDNLNRLAELFNVPISTLIDKDEVIANSVQIPVLGRVQAGVPTSAIQEVLDYEEIDRATAIKGEYFALQIRGLSMMPNMRPKDVVIVQKQNTVENGQIAVVLVNGDDATVKKVVRQENGILLIPFNSDFAPMFYSNEEIETLPVTIIGRVIECRQKY